jgi:alpha-beta hydrolase superfamily lysophospholipase
MWHLNPAQPPGSRTLTRWKPSQRPAELLESADGAELRGTTPEDPEAIVLILHGGAETSLEPVAWWRLPVLRMQPFAKALEDRAGDRFAVLRLKYRVRGWNAPRQDPVLDARWALDRIRGVYPGVPIALVGHSMGGRVALHLAADPDVSAVVALAPWVENDVRQPAPGTPVLLMHGTRDRVTDPRRTQVIARRFAQAGVAVRHIRVEGETHAMLRHAREWHEMVAHFLTGSLLGRRRAS